MGIRTNYQTEEVKMRRDQEAINRKINNVNYQKKRRLTRPLAGNQTKKMKAVPPFAEMGYATRAP